MQKAGRDQSDEPSPAPGKRSARSDVRLGNVALALISTLVSLLAIEIGYRVVAALPMLKLANWRTEQVVMVNLGELKAIPDPLLGWTNKASS